MDRPCCFLLSQYYSLRSISNYKSLWHIFLFLPFMHNKLDVKKKNLFGETTRRRPIRSGQQAFARHYIWRRFGWPCLVHKNFSTFVFIWQILSNHRVTSLKRFISQVNCVISFYFYLYLMLHACDLRFDVTESLENFCELNKASIYHSFKRIVLSWTRQAEDWRGRGVPAEGRRGAARYRSPVAVGCVVKRRVALVSPVQSSGCLPHTLLCVGNGKPRPRRRRCWCGGEGRGAKPSGRSRQAYSDLIRSVPRRMRVVRWRSERAAAVVLHCLTVWMHAVDVDKLVSLRELNVSLLKATRCYRSVHSSPSPTRLQSLTYWPHSCDPFLRRRCINARQEPMDTRTCPHSVITSRPVEWQLHGDLLFFFYHKHGDLCVIFV
jgi:hypothetical protein